MSGTRARHTSENARLAKAWVNFDGTTGTTSQDDVTINSSFNISSVTDRATGRYTLNFETAMANTNYAAAGMCGNGVDTNITSTHDVMQDTVLTTSSFGVKCSQSNTDIDKVYIAIIIFGD